MILARFTAALWLLLLAGCSGHGDPQYSGDPPPAEATFGQCAFCHSAIAASMLPAGADLRCELCHANARPGFTGPDHRSLPSLSQVPSFPGPSHALGAQSTFESCAYCHNNVAVDLTPLQAELSCQTCHAEQTPGAYGPGHQTLPASEQVPDPPASAHRPGPESVFGSCAQCHNSTAKDIEPLKTELSCQTCHADVSSGRFGQGHQSLPSPAEVPDPPLAAHEPGPEGVFGSCAHCHNGLATDVLPVAGELRCETCHNDANPGVFGPGHRRLPDSSQVPDPPPASAHQPGAEQGFGSCAYCHNSAAVHLRPVSADLSCATCHRATGAGEFGPGHQTLPAAQQVPDPPVSAHDPGAEQVFGSCAYCHNQAAIDVQPVSADLRCETCHADKTPGMTGPGHRSRPSAAQVPDPPATTHRPGAERTFGACAHCHNDAAGDIMPYAADLQCATCHADAGTGAYGPRHQTLPSQQRVPDPPQAAHRPGAESVFASCAFCHNRFAARMAPVGDELRCTVCHGDTLPGQYGPGHRGQPEEELVPAFIGSEHAAGDQRRFGSCAYCHADLGGAVLTSGDTELSCLTCHAMKLSEMFGPQHRSIPGADLVPAFVGASHRLGDEARFGNCGFCHNDVTGRGLEHTHGAIEVECASCHESLQPGVFGAEHQRITPCVDCHGTMRQSHHDPESGSARECAVCHDPHGSSNLYLVAEYILTPSGTSRPVSFTTLRGLAEGGLASLSQPGSGLCETCHSQTRYFRADGSGEPHFGFPCFTCHPHELGFSARP